jgi:hypothetical protein
MDIERCGGYGSARRNGNPPDAAFRPAWPTVMSTVAPGAVFPLTVAWVCWVVRPGSWLARMSSVMAGAAVDVLGGVATAPGAVTLKVSGTVAGGPLLT